MTSRDIVLVKLGGSVITDKSRLRTFRRETCDRLAAELGRCGSALVVVHGAGSFGHIIAKEHRLHEGFRDVSQLQHVASVQRDVRELNIRVIESLIDAGVKAVSVPPAASSDFSNGRVVRFDPSLFEKMLRLDLAPVTFGDVVPDDEIKFSICSGDLMMHELAVSLRPRMAVFCADVDGVYTSDPKTAPGAELIPRLDEEVLAGLARTEAVNADVTGSIFGKLDRMLDIAGNCEKCMILNGDVPGRLEGALKGEDVPSTTVLPRQVRR